jgi:VWFA-related protein
MKNLLRRRFLSWLLPLALLTALSAQTQPSAQPTPPAQIPDAPSTVKPPSQFPANTAPAPKSGDRPDLPPTTTDTQPSPPPATVNTVPAGTAATKDANSRGEFTIPIVVNMVVVPVTVKDSSGHLVAGLVKNDFSILENGVQQPVKLFTSDPFPLSVAVVLDSSLPAQTIRKINETLPALTSAFSDFDEVGLFTYGNTVQRRLGFSTSAQELATALRRSEIKGANDGPPISSGPLYGGPTPTVNNHPFDPGAQRINTVRKESSVLNDAILAAAQELAKRDRARRKVIFVISDGREDGSDATYGDVLKVLLSNEVSVYAIAVDAGAIPVYNQIEKIHVPFMGYGNILPKYVSATGGEVFAEFTKEAIEVAYSRVTEEARNQYTLAYTTRSGAAGDYRSIEVLVHRPGLEVHAKDGYYPLPPPR